MATTKDDIKTGYPLPVYNYRVEIAGTAVSFSEASGLDITRETTTYKESPADGEPAGPKTMHMPAQGSPASLTLKKGVVQGKSVPVLYDWISGIQFNQVEKKDIYIRLCDEKGDAVLSWKVSNAFPTKLEAPSFTADSNDVAIESMELMGDGVSIATE